MNRLSSVSNWGKKWSNKRAFTLSANFKFYLAQVLELYQHIKVFENQCNMMWTT